MRKYILASASPRRQYLLKEAGIDFECIPCIGVDEELIASQIMERNNVELYWIPETLAKEKAREVETRVPKGSSIIISADTIVVLDGKILGKPKSEMEAVEMLRKLSGNKHTVITGVCLIKAGEPGGISMFNVKTEVNFKRLREDQIQHYVSTYQPLDKAGAYGIQEWIGYYGVSGINGCFYNVMGLPLSALMEELERFEGA
ncbi:MAG: Maf family protein [Chitinophagales bacterium]|jgi:septum formation protein|nr:Maf family protein [Chitinophagales bacterium]